MPIDSRGPRISLIGLALAGALALGACSGSSSSPDGTQSAATVTRNAATATVGSRATATIAGRATATATPRATAAASATVSGSSVTTSDLQAVSQAWSKVERYRATTTLYGSDGAAQYTTTMEVVSPDRQHITLEQNEQRLEWIVIGDTGYANVGGSWIEVPIEGVRDALPFDPQDTLGILTTLPDRQADVTRVGEDTIDGVVTVVWEVSSPNTTTTTRIWVGQTDNLPRKLETDSGAGRLETRIADFNGDITIEPPV